MKKIILGLLIVCMMVSLSACGKESNEENLGANDYKDADVFSEVDGEGTLAENEQADEMIAEKENALESIQEEIARIEKQSIEHCDIDSSNMGQQQMNQHSAEWYQLWDDELNSLWSRLSNELDAETKAKMLEEQRAWIKRKEGNAKAAGIEALFGSLQPLLESETAAEMTRARVYVMASYLAEVRGEDFTISSEIWESLDKAEPNMDEVFAQFEGKWVFDESRSAGVGVERTEDCEYAVDGSKWTVWVTGGDLFSDLDVYGYTERNILFKLPQGTYYELSFGIEGELLLTYMPALEIEEYEKFETIVCYPLSEEEEMIYLSDN